MDRFQRNVERRHAREQTNQLELIEARGAQNRMTAMQGFEFNRNNMTAAQRANAANDWDYTQARFGSGGTRVSADTRTNTGTRTRQSAQASGGLSFNDQLKARKFNEDVREKDRYEIQESILNEKGEDTGRTRTVFGSHAADASRDRSNWNRMKKAKDKDKMWDSFSPEDQQSFLRHKALQSRMFNLDRFGAQPQGQQPQGQQPQGGGVTQQRSFGSRGGTNPYRSTGTSARESYINALRRTRETSRWYANNPIHSNTTGEGSVGRNRREIYQTADGTWTNYPKGGIQKGMTAYGSKADTSINQQPVTQFQEVNTPGVTITPDEIAQADAYRVKQNAGLTSRLSNPYSPAEERVLRQKANRRATLDRYKRVNAQNISIGPDDSPVNWKRGFRDLGRALNIGSYNRDRL